MIIGTAGHIDHGKTSLVKLLTGVDTDRLPEEKKRGITIELGFAYTRNTAGEMVGFVDVPGHEKFINTMVAGAIGIDHGLLVIAADDGMMPQTIEHLRIMELLDVKELTVAITKIDMVSSEQVNALQQMVSEFLLTTPYVASPIFYVSNSTKSGIEALKTHLFALRAPSYLDSHGFRLAIDRVFVTKGLGVTITGAIQSGKVTVGDSLLLMPENILVKVRSIHSQGQVTQEAVKGNRCGIVLSGVDLADVSRGQWLVASELQQQVDRFDAWIELPVDAKYSIKDGDLLLLHHGTDFTSVRLILLERSEVKAGQGTMVQCVLQKELSVCWNDRFILRDMSARFSIAGGRVLDINPPLRNRKSEDRRAFLKTLIQDSAEQTFLNLLHCSTQPLAIHDWAKAFNLPSATLIDLAKNADAIIFQQGQFVFCIDQTMYQSFEQTIHQYLKDDIEKHPDALGVHLGQLRSLFKPKIEPSLFSILIKQLVHSQALFKVGPRYALSRQGNLFNQQEKIIWEKVHLSLESYGFNPPNLRELVKQFGIAEPLLKNVLYKAVQQHLLIVVNQDIYYPISTMKKLASILENIVQEQQHITVVELRDRLQIGRNRVIHIIETFDKMGFTHRIVKKHPITKELTDYRVIKNKGLWQDE